MITRTSKGTASSKTNGTSLSLASVSIAQDGSVEVNLAHDPVAVTSVTWNGNALTKIKEETNTGNVQGSIWVLHDCTAATGSVDVTFTAAIDAKAMSVVQLLGPPSTAGGNIPLATDVSASDQGSGTSPSSGATAALSFEGAIAIGMLGVEFTWGSGGTGSFTFGGQSPSTSGGAADTNIGVADYYLQVGDSTAAVTFANTGATSGDWVALVAVFYETIAQIQVAQQSRTHFYTQDRVEVAQQSRSHFYTQDRVEVSQQSRSFFYSQDRVEIAQQYRTFWYVEAPASPDDFAAIL